ENHRRANALSCQPRTGMIIDDAPAKTESKPAASNPAHSNPADTAGTTSAKSDAPTNYSRGEGQKGVTQAYRDNWHVIFGDQKPARSRSSKPARKSGAKAKPASMRRKAYTRQKQ